MKSSNNCLGVLEISINPPNEYKIHKQWRQSCLGVLEISINPPPKKNGKTLAGMGKGETVGSKFRSNLLARLSDQTFESWSSPTFMIPMTRFFMPAQII